MIDDSGIHGIGTVNGGTYKNLKIAGSATVQEDCKAEKIKIAGNADFQKSVTAKSFKVILSLFASATTSYISNGSSSLFLLRVLYSPLKGCNSYF